MKTEVKKNDYMIPEIDEIPININNQIMDASAGGGYQEGGGDICDDDE